MTRFIERNLQEISLHQQLLHFFPDLAADIEGEFAIVQLGNVQGVGVLPHAVVRRRGRTLAGIVVLAAVHRAATAIWLRIVLVATNTATLGADRNID